MKTTSIEIERSEYEKKEVKDLWWWEQNEKKTFIIFFAAHIEEYISFTLPQCLNSRNATLKDYYFHFSLFSFRYFLFQNTLFGFMMIVAFRFFQQHALSHFKLEKKIGKINERKTITYTFCKNTNYDGDSIFDVFIWPAKWSVLFLCSFTI